MSNDHFHCDECGEKIVSLNDFLLERSYHKKDCSFHTAFGRRNIIGDVNSFTKDSFIAINKELGKRPC